MSGLLPKGLMTDVLIVVEIVPTYDKIAMGRPGSFLELPLYYY
jgi:hypothetical protein